MKNQSASKNLLRPLKELDFRRDMNPETIDHRLLGTAEAAIELRTAYLEYLRFLRDDLENFEEEQDLFIILDRTLAKLAYCIRRHEFALGQLEECLAPDQGIGSHAQYSTTELSETDKEESRAWATMVRQVAARTRRILSRYDLFEDSYLNQLDPNSPVTEKASFCQDLAEIYADFHEVERSFEVWQHSDNSGRGLHSWLETLELHLQDHTMRHLFAAQYLARIYSGLGA